MPLITELALPELPVRDQGFANDPEPRMAAARAQHPWLARSEVGFIVHGYQAIKDLLPRDAELVAAMDQLVGIYGGEGTAWGRFQKEQILGVDGDKHLRIRKSAADAFQPSKVKRFREASRIAITRLLDEWIPKGAFDFTDFASYFPVTNLCTLLGISPEPIPRIRMALESQAQVTSMDPALLPALEAGFAVLWEFLDALILDRGKDADEPEGLLDALIDARNGGLIDDTELRDLLIVLFVAGYGTSKTLLSVIANTLIDRPADWERCSRDPHFCVKVVEEALRQHGIANAVRRVDVEFEYEGIVFPRGTTLILLLSKAGRDPAFFPDAIEFDPERAFSNRHVSFGLGSHQCLGQHLARLQIAEALHMISQRLKNPVRTGEVVWRPFMTGGGIKSLPISFDAADASSSTTEVPEFEADAGNDPDARR